MGRVTGPFGIKGWLKVDPFCAAPENLLAYPRWWIGRGEEWQERGIEHAHVQSGAVVAKLAGCNDREAAALYRGHEVAVARAELPAPGSNEFYWADLIGLKVLNAAKDDLGIVRRVFETGANDVLVVEGDRERLLPFTEEVVRRVDIAAGVILVEWSADY